MRKNQNSSEMEEIRNPRTANKNWQQIISARTQAFAGVAARRCPSNYLPFEDAEILFASRDACVQAEMNY